MNRQRLTWSLAENRASPRQFGLLLPPEGRLQRDVRQSEGGSDMTDREHEASCRSADTQSRTSRRGTVMHRISERCPPSGDGKSLSRSPMEWQTDAVGVHREDGLYHPAPGVAELGTVLREQNHSFQVRFGHFWLPRCLDSSEGVAEVVQEFRGLARH